MNIYEAKNLPSLFVTKNVCIMCSFSQGPLPLCLPMYVDINAIHMTCT